MGVSVAMYLAAVFGGVMLPLPRLGITEAILPQLGLPGSGEWIERPHVAVAGMAFYFLASAWFKWASTSRGTGIALPGRRAS